MTNDSGKMVYEYEVSRLNSKAHRQSVISGACEKGWRICDLALDPEIEWAEVAMEQEALEVGFPDTPHVTLRTRFGYLLTCRCGYHHLDAILSFSFDAIEKLRRAVLHPLIEAPYPQQVLKELSGLRVWLTTPVSQQLGSIQGWDLKTEEEFGVKLRLELDWIANESELLETRIAHSAYMHAREAARDGR